MTEQRPTDIAPPAEPNPTGEPQPGSPEILDLATYGGLYGRLLTATQFLPKDFESILNPEAPLPPGLIIPKITPDEDRDYSPITWNLSARERVNAWGKTPFDRAYAEWKTKFTNAINADQKRKDAFAVIYGREADQFSENDTDSLYETLCSGKSDTSQFSRTIADSLQGDDKKVDPEKLQKLLGLKTQIEWIASKLFGKQTSSVVARMVEIEASITSEGQAAIDAIISKPERLMNKLTENEIKILAPVYRGIVEGPPPGLEIVPVAPLETSEEEEENEDEDKQEADAKDDSSGQELGQEKKPIELPYARESGITGLADTMVEVLDNHLDEQSVTFRTSKDVIPRFLPLILGGKLASPDNLGEVDFGLEGKLTLKGIPMKNGSLLKLSVGNSEDRKGLRLKVLDGKIGRDRDIKKALPRFNESIVQFFNTIIKDKLPKWGINRLYLEGEGQDIYLRLEVIPEGESVKTTPEAVPKPPHDPGAVVPDHNSQDRSEPTSI